MSVLWGIWRELRRTETLLNNLTQRLDEPQKRERSVPPADGIHLGVRSALANTFSAGEPNTDQRKNFNHISDRAGLVADQVGLKYKDTHGNEATGAAALAAFLDDYHKGDSETKTNLQPMFDLIKHAIDGQGAVSCQNAGNLLGALPVFFGADGTATHAPHSENLLQFLQQATGEKAGEHKAALTQLLQVMPSLIAKGKNGSPKAKLPLRMILKGLNSEHPREKEMANRMLSILANPNPGEEKAVLDDVEAFCKETKHLDLNTPEDRQKFEKAFNEFIEKVRPKLTEEGRKALRRMELDPAGAVPSELAQVEQKDKEKQALEEKIKKAKSEEEKAELAKTLAEVNAQIKALEGQMAQAESGKNAIGLQAMGALMQGMMQMAQIVDQARQASAQALSQQQQQQNAAAQKTAQSQGNAAPAA